MRARAAPMPPPQVCAAGSDIDATLMVQSCAAHEQTAAERLESLSERLKGNGLNVVKVLGAFHPILVVQKDATQGIGFDVDISFAGHLEIHKSHKVKQRFQKSEDRSAFKLALLVKTWATKCNMKSKDGFLTSHAWMLLVIRYMHCSANIPVVGFFTWFAEEYPTSTDKWVIGNGDAPLDFEPNNAAELVTSEKRDFIHARVCEAIKDVRHQKLPWASVKPYKPK